MEEKLNYLLIASDLDGTLLKEDKTVDKKTLDRIRRYVAAGGKFCICTGRMLPSVRLIAEDLSLTGIATSYAGALVSDLSTGKTLCSLPLSVQDAAEIARFIEADGVHLQYFVGEEYYVNSDGDLLERYEKSCRVKANVVTDMPLSEHILRGGKDVNKLLIIVDDPTRHERLLRKYTDRFGNRFWVTRSTSRYIEFMSKSCNKGTALEFMANYYGIPLEKTIAIGDQMNDEEMLLRAGLGFCVENGNDELKKRVKTFPLTNDEGAVGEIIERYGFYKE